MYIKQAFKFLHEWWRYVVGVIIIFAASQLGSLPFIGAAFFKAISDGDGLEALEDQNNLMKILDSNLTLFLLLLSFAVGLLGVYVVVKYLHRQPFKTVTTSRKKTDWGRVWFAFGLIACTTIVLTTIDYYSNPDDYVVQFDAVPFIILAIISIIMIPLQTSFEEYLFRGYLMQGLGVSSINKGYGFIVFYCLLFAIVYIALAFNYPLSFIHHLGIILTGSGVLLFLVMSKIIDKIQDTSFNKTLNFIFSRKSTALFVTSIIFGGLHFFNPEVEKLGPIIMIYYIGTGFFLGIMTLMDEGMELALGFHAGNNMIAAMLVTADWTVFQTNSILKDVSEPSAGFDVIAPVLILYPLFLGIMAWRYKWTGWGEKLFGKVTPPPEPIQGQIE